MHLVFRDLLGYLQSLLQVRTAPAVVPHVGFDHHGHIVLGMGHHLVEHFVHKAHAVFERAAVGIVPVVGARTDELRDQVGMTGMDLHTVKTRLTGEIDRFAESFDQLLDFLHLQPTVWGGRIEIETGRCADRHAVAGVEVGHIAAVAQLDAGFGAFGMNVVGQLFQLRQNFIVYVQLSVERNAAQIHGAVGHRCHAHATAGHTDMVIVQHPGGGVVLAHILKRRRTDKAVAQRDGA